MKMSVKAKILFTMITLSVVSLSVFGYFTFSTYKDDKVAFIYDYLTSETQGKARLFTVSTEDHELFLGSVVSQLNSSAPDKMNALIHFLNGDQKKILGAYYSSPLQGEKILFESVDTKVRERWSLKDLDSAPVGLSLIDSKSGYFVLKKLVGEDAYAALVFRQLELWNVLGSSEGRYNYLINRDQVISKDEIPLDASELKSIGPKVEVSPGTFGLFEATIQNENYYVTYSKLGSRGLILINLIKSDKVLLVEKVLLKQIVSFLVLMVSISLLVGTIASRWLTWHLDGLTFAAQEMEKENFDVKIAVTSTDELGTLGTAFNNMSGRIKNLLETLRLYNLELEERVRARTLELQHLTDIQKGMLNALGQGFVIVDKAFKILPVYSKVAEEMFEVVPDEAAPSSIMGLSKEEGETFKEFFELVFNGAIGFEDMSKLAPDNRINSKNQRLQLNYAPITSGESNNFEYILIVGTDKTAEYENMEKFKKEWNFSQMVVKIASNRFAFKKIISESLNMLNKCQETVGNNYPFALREVQRLIHTIKGSFAYFHVLEVTHLCHEFETYLQDYYDEQSCDKDLKATVESKIAAVQVALECYIEHYDNIIHYNEVESKIIPVSELVEFSKVLRKASPELGEAFGHKFFKTKVAPYFQMYPSIVSELGTKLGKDVRFKLIGENLEIPDGPWEEIFQQFVHFIRNSVDHGIESEGEITFNFSNVKFQSEECLQVVLQDNGRGVDWEKLATKDPSITSLEDALERIKTGGLSAKDEVSETSGRGVGVSSLFHAVANYGGYSEFKSNKGQGMSIKITLPYNRLHKKPVRLVA
jgi:two-component system, chemotaxis family, sensor kinase CheA